MKQQRRKGIEIGEVNRINAQPLEKSESMEADNRQPNPFLESSMPPALTIGTETVSFLRMNNEEESAENKESDASNHSGFPPQQR